MSAEAEALIRGSIDHSMGHQTRFTTGAIPNKNRNHLAQVDDWFISCLICRYYFNVSEHYCVACTPVESCPLNIKSPPLERAEFFIISPS